MHFDLGHQHILLDEQECEITLYKFRRIKVRFPYEFDQYIETMLEEGEMEVNQKLLHFLNYLM